MEPSLLTLQPQRAPLAVLSIHIPTAVLPSIAQAGEDNEIVAKPKKARSKEDVVFIIRISPKLVKPGIERLLPNLYVGQLGLCSLSLNATCDRSSFTL